MSSSFAQSLLLAPVAERELDLGIHAIADTAVRTPYGRVTMNLGVTRAVDGLNAINTSTVRTPYGRVGMNLGVTRAVEGLNAIDTSAVRTPYGRVGMNLGATRDVLVIAGSNAS
jgi:hypothetical protein